MVQHASLWPRKGIVYLPGGGLGVALHNSHCEDCGSGLGPISGPPFVTVCEDCLQRRAERADPFVRMVIEAEENALKRAVRRVFSWAR